jgi:ABC-type nitrate/sulfonate/bicarbonate transport system permease component
MGAKQKLYALSLLSLVVGIGLWWLASALISDAALLPSPSEVVRTGITMGTSGVLAKSMAASMERVIVGYVAGVLIGILTGLLLGQFKVLNDIFGPVFEFLKGIPPIALVPMLVLWFGIGELPRYIIVGYIVWIIVMIGTYTGVREIPDVRRRAGLFMGFSHAAILFRVILPSAMPYTLGAMRSAIGFAFIAVVSAELIAAKSGLGFIIMDARYTSNTSQTIVGVLALGLLGTLTQWLFDFSTSRSTLISRYARK